jgi:diphosphomevalonate decarboxylase
MMMTSSPYYILIKPNTLEIINEIWNFRKNTNYKVCFTLDAGANIHLLYPKENFTVVQEFISNNLSRFCQNGEFINDHVGIGPNKL